MTLTADHRGSGSNPPHRSESRRRTIGTLLSIASILVLAASGADGDDESTGAVTEYVNAPRRLISLLHEPHAAAVTPDGTHLATGHNDGSIVLWRVDTGRPVRSFVGHTDTVSSLAFDASGERLASGSYDATVRVWSVATGEAASVLTGHESRVTTVVFSPDGEWLVSGGYDKTARLWNLQDPAAEPVVLALHEATVRAVGFSPDGTQVATGDDTGTLRVWNTDNPSDPRSIEAQDGPLRTLLFSPDGSTIVIGADNGAVSNWQTANLERAVGIDGTSSRPQHGAPVLNMVVSPDGRLLATADQRGEVYVWDLIAEEETSLLDGHEDEIVGLALPPDSQAILTVGRDRTVNLWRAKRPLTPRLAAIDNGDDVRLWALAVAPGAAAVYVGGRHGYLAAWDLQTGARTRQIEGFAGTIDAVALTADGSHIACCSWKEDVVAVFDIESGEQAAEFKTGENVRCVRFSPDDRWLTAGCEDGMLHLWEWRTDADPTRIQNGSLPVYDIAFSPGGGQLVTVSGEWRSEEPGSVTFWKPGDAAGTWSEARKLTEHTRAVRAVAFNRDGSRVASAGEEGLVIVWDAARHVPIARLKNATGVRPLAFAPAGDRLAVALHDGTINVWDIAREEIVQRFQSEDDAFALSYSEDGSVLFSVSGEQNIEIWPAARGPSTAERVQEWATESRESRDESQELKD